MKLKANPRTFLTNNDSPFSLHAQKRWLQKNPSLDNKRKKILDTILKTQSADGSWDGLVLPTIQNLFSLWLLQEEPNEQIHAALDWMLETDHPPMQCTSTDGAPYDNLFFRTTREDNRALLRISGVPFTQGCSGFVKMGAALFFACVFGRGWKLLYTFLVVDALERKEIEWGYR